MASNSLLSINLLSPVLFYQNPVDIYQTQNGSTQVNGTACEYGSCRGCNKNLTSNNPSSQYQRQKLIQNTVRVYSSLYTMNLAGLSGYQKPLNKYQLVEQNGTFYLAPPRVYWNQMSDRAVPANQTVKIASGSTYHTSSTRHTITRNRPGAMSPGGIGVDIKHNSYDRYLNKIKGKAPLRRGVIPPYYGAPIPFDRAFPVYGGKTVKTSIINGCDCPDILDNNQTDKLIYNSKTNAIQDDLLSVKYKFSVGDFVLAKIYDTEDKLYKGQIISIDGGDYTVNFDGIIRILSYCNLFIYFDCNKCAIDLSIKDKLVNESTNTQFARTLENEFATGNNIYCNLLNFFETVSIL